MSRNLEQLKQTYQILSDSMNKLVNDLNTITQEFDVKSEGGEAKMVELLHLNKKVVTSLNTLFKLGDKIFAADENLSDGNGCSTSGNEMLPELQILDNALEGLQIKTKRERKIVERLTGTKIGK